MVFTFATEACEHCEHYISGTVPMGTLEVHPEGSFFEMRMLCRHICDSLSVFFVVVSLCHAGSVLLRVHGFLFGVYKGHIPN